MDFQVGLEVRHTNAGPFLKKKKEKNVALTALGTYCSAALLLQLLGGVSSEGRRFMVMQSRLASLLVKNVL